MSSTLNEIIYKGSVYKIIDSTKTPKLSIKDKEYKIIVQDPSSKGFLIINPETGKYVKDSGPTGKNLLTIPFINFLYVKITSAQKMDQSEKIKSEKNSIKSSFKNIDPERMESVNSAILTVNNLSSLPVNEVVDELCSKANLEDLLKQLGLYVNLFPSLSSFKPKLENLANNKSMKSSFGAHSLKSYRVKIKSNKKLKNIIRKYSTNKNISKSVNKNTKSIHKKGRKSVRNSKYGKIYGLQDSRGYTGVFPFMQNIVPKDYLGDPMNAGGLFLPNLNNVKRDYTNYGGNHGSRMNTFGNPSQPIRPIIRQIPRPVQKKGF